MIEKVEQGNITIEEFHHILQGFRNKKSKDLFLKLKDFLLNSKDTFFPPAQEGQEKRRSEEIVNALFSLASNKPKNFGVYRVVVRDQIDEVIASYQEDIYEALKTGDGELVTRVAQFMYLFKTTEFENIWWRIENRVHELLEQEGALDIYNLTNIVRSFSRSQDNIMAGSDKLLVHMEPLIMANMDKIESQDLPHLLYGYSVRKAGNPELYEAFNKRLHAMIDEGEMWDYQFLFNLNYYLMFSDNVDKRIWEHLVESTLYQDDVLPMYFYKAFKYSRFYLEHHFPEWDVSEYIDRFYFAERYFNQS
mmetsp:Transcript_8571/g.14460  ORF Transcript_8571/g.14460 Transcript_8571/m.14460 type:complete len:306 (+) Transcript_8571:891-1808(+)